VFFVKLQAPKSVVPLQLVEGTPDGSESSSSSSSDDSEEEEAGSQVDASSLASEPVPGPSGLHTPDLRNKRPADDDDRSDVSSASEATVPYCDNSDSNSNVSSPNGSRESSPYRTNRDLKSLPSSRLNQSSDLSRESTPCVSPADYLPRRSARFERTSDTSRDASPLIFDANFGLRRGSRRRTGLKNIPPYNAARDLTSFLLDDNSVSNSSIVGENSLSDIGSSQLFGKNENSRQSSCETGDSSSFCDINNLFSTSKHLDDGEDVHLGFTHKVESSVDSESCSGNLSAALREIGQNVDNGQGNVEGVNTGNTRVNGASSSDGVAGTREEMDVDEACETHLDSQSHIKAQSNGNHNNQTIVEDKCNHTSEDTNDSFKDMCYLNNLESKSKSAEHEMHSPKKEEISNVVCEIENQRAERISENDHSENFVNNSEKDTYPVVKQELCEDKTSKPEVDNGKGINSASPCAQSNADVKIEEDNKTDIKLEAVEKERPHDDIKEENDEESLMVELKTERDEDCEADEDHVVSKLYSSS